MLKEIIKQNTWRYAVKRFDPSKKLSEGQVSLIKDILVKAPTSFGLQIWQALIISDPQLKQLMQPACWNQPQIVEASHIVVLCRPNQFHPHHIERYIDRFAQVRQIERKSLNNYAQMIHDFVNTMTEDEKICWMEKQIYLIAGKLLGLTAIAKIDSCPMEGFDAQQLNKLLKLDQKDLSVVLVIALGFRSKKDTTASAPKIRFDLNELIHEL